jgi:hypothetical protein
VNNDIDMYGNQYDDEGKQKSGFKTLGVADG